MAIMKNASNNYLSQRTKWVIIVLSLFVVILVAANGWLVFWYVPDKTTSGSTNIKNEYPLLNPARSIYGQDDLIINVQPLRDELNEIGKDKNVSIYFEYLPTGANITVNRDAEFWPASLLKVPVAMAAVKKIENGIWKWENELVIMSSDKSDRFGELYKQPIGTRLTIKELIKLALTESDNTANFVLVRNLEPSEFQDIYDHLGLSEFISSEGKIGAKKYSVMFRALYNASYLSEENSHTLLSLMAETPFKEYVQSGFPHNITFSHKIGIGDDKGVFLDSGIVYAPRRPYLLTVMVNTKDIAFAQKQMKEISEMVYNYIVNYKN